MTNQSLTSNATRLDELQAEQLRSSRGILQAQKIAERYIVKRQTLTNRKEECNKSIRDLGALPQDAYRKYTEEKQPEKASIGGSISLVLVAAYHSSLTAGQETA